ncbi:MAG: 3-ketoacyl-ACP reductase [Planctomycetota bacterium]
MTKSDKPVALVTGGSRGIGLGIALQLAASGYDIVINGRREADSVADSMAQIEAAGAQCHYVRADISDLEGHQAALDSIRNRFGRLDALINNAGVAPSERADILEATPDSFDRLVSINLRGPYFLTQLVSNWMVDQRKAAPNRQLAIIFVTSISATVASTNRGDYCISKAALAMASALYAARLGEHNIPVYEVRPGIIKTDMTSTVTDKYDKLFAEGIAVDRRWGSPDDVGKVVAALVRGDLPYATGQHIMVDGGLTLQRI